MMKSFKPQPWLLPQPVLIIGTYDEQGRPNAMNAAWGGQWDMKEIMISMGKHATTENLNRQGDFTVAFATQATMTAADYVGKNRLYRGHRQRKEQPAKDRKNGMDGRTVGKRRRSGLHRLPDDV